jgi:hypothetical protein
MRREDLGDLVERSAADWIRSAINFGRGVAWREYGDSETTIHVVDASRLPPEASRRVLAWTTAEGLEQLLRDAGLVTDARSGPAVVVDLLGVVERKVAWRDSTEYQVETLGNVYVRQTILHELGHALAAEAAREKLMAGVTLPLLVEAAAADRGQEIEDRQHCRQWARAYLHLSDRASRVTWPHRWWIEAAAADVARYLDASQHEIEELASTLRPEIDDDGSIVDVLRRDPPPAFTDCFDRLAARRQETRLLANKRSKMIQTLLALRQRSQSRSDQALDVLAKAARDQAAGLEVDVQAVDSALHELKLNVDDFARMVEAATRRRSALADLEKLAVARGKRDKAQTQLDQEKVRISEAIEAYEQRAAAIAGTLQAAQAVVDAAEAARRVLLVPDDVPGVVGRVYREAIERAATATKEHDSISQRHRETNGRVSLHAGWIKKLSSVEAESLVPSSWVAPQGQPEWQRDGHDGQLEEHHKQWRRASRELADIETELAAAKEEVDAAKRALAAAELDALKA